MARPGRGAIPTAGSQRGRWLPPGARPVVPPGPNGRGGPQDYATARKWCEKAAVQGNAWAQAQLGQLYANGRGMPQDLTTARKWYEKAAAQGNAWAQAQLALL